MKEKGIKVLLTISIFLASFLMPFSVYADTVLTSDNVIGINVYTTPVSEESFIQNNVEYYKSTAIVNVEFELDQSYLGWVNLGFVIKYKGHNLSSGWTDYTKSWSGNYYVNGSVINIEVPISWNSVLSGYYMGSGHLPSSSSDLQNITYSNQGSITPIGDLSTLQDILEVLQDIQQNVEIDILGELQQIVIDLGLANQYLEEISLYRKWNFPVESFSFISSFLYYNKAYLKDYYQVNNEYTFPIFNIPSGATIYNLSSGADKFRCIMFIGNSQAYSLSNVSNILIDFGSLNVNNFKYWSNTRMWQNGATGYFVSFDITLTSYTSFIIKSRAGYPVIPIYFDSLNKPNVSTEFALQFGLTNRFLDDISSLAQGTTASNNAASGLESQNTQMADDMDDLATIESGYNQQFNDQLENIDFTNPITSNQGILPAANFVITVFNGLISNNPFSVLIIIVCILLIGKKVIGK